MTQARADYILSFRRFHHIDGGYTTGISEQMPAAAIDICTERNILRDYLIKHKAEVTGMILTEYNETLHEKTLREEGIEEGRKEGHKEGREEGIREGIQKGIIKGRGEEREKNCRQMAEAVRNLMEKLDLSSEEAMDLLGFSEEDREQYRALL